MVNSSPTDNIKKGFTFLIAVLLILEGSVNLSYGQSGFGSIEISSIPQGGKVFLDGTYVGNAPLKIERVSIGKHEIKVVKDDYQDKRRWVSISEGEARRVVVVLSPLPGAISVTSVPRGAWVYLDGEFKGLVPQTSPLTISDLPQGRYQIKIALGSYRDWAEDVFVLKNKTTKVEAALQLKDISLVVNSSPPGAQVYLDSLSKGITPLTIGGMSPTEYLLELVKEGYFTWSKTITVENKNEDIINIRLQPTSVSLGISVALKDKIIPPLVPLDTKIYVDGSEVGIAPLVVENISTGDHLVKAIRWGYGETTYKLDLQPDGSKQIKIELEEALWKRVAEWGLLIGGLASGVGASFTYRDAQMARTRYAETDVQSEMDKYIEEIRLNNILTGVLIGLGGGFVGGSIILFAF